jgi:hypothetical protein
MLLLLLFEMTPEKIEIYSTICELFSSVEPEYPGISSELKIRGKSF